MLILFITLVRAAAVDQKSCLTAQIGYDYIVYALDAIVEQYMERYMKRKETLGNYLTYQQTGYMVHRIEEEPLVKADQDGSLQVGVLFASKGF
jgi:hypothetical protein